MKDLYDHYSAWTFFWGIVAAMSMLSAFIVVAPAPSYWTYASGFGTAMTMVSAHLWGREADRCI